MALFSKGKEVFGCPMDGEVRPLNETPDRAFAEGLLGDGVVIFPSGDKVFAPSAAKVNFTFPTRHAVGLETKSGYEYLIHVGINTNQLRGEGFYIYVEPGDYVNKGQLLLEFDQKLLKEKNLSEATPIVFANVERDNIEVLKAGRVKANEDLMVVKK